MRKGEKVVTNEPLKAVVDEDEVSVAMKLESYPNRDSTVFMDRFSMPDCHTFIRGTYRFKGFSGIISAFHDVGLTSDDPIPDGIHNLKELCAWRFSLIEPKVHQGFEKGVIAGQGNDLSKDDKDLTRNLLNRVDFSYLKGDEHEIAKCIKRIVKSMKFLGFYGPSAKIVGKDSQGKPRPCLDAFGDILAKELKHESHDRDLIVMQHKFIIEDKEGVQYKHTSTMMQSGQSAKSGGQSIMSQTVGITCGIGARMILEGRIKRKGVISPIYKDIYEPILKELEDYGVVMVEESERPGALRSAANRSKL
jgi:saccharopine dehydrogenase (NADP+, L-glutamate forming)